LDSFEEHAVLLQPNPCNAQILLELDAQGGTLEEALRILKTAGVETVRYAVIRREFPMEVLIQLSSRDMRGAVLRLSEAGFPKVKGINARQV
jgi:hypothetical protein